jgi:signal transduction histidine kinase/ActR/RegA family two-component response regulator
MLEIFTTEMIWTAGFWTAVNWAVEKSSATAASFFSPSYSTKSTQEYLKLLKENQELKKSIEELKQQKAFLNIICHEVRTPLSIISAYAELLKELFPNNKLATATNEEIIEGIKAISAAATQQRRIIDHFLDLSKWEEGKFELNITPFNLSKVFRKLQKSFNQLLTHDSLSIHLDLPLEEDIWVESDKGLLTQLLNNLISNAIKFTHGKGNLIMLQLNYPAAPKIGEELTVTVTVKDTGIGMNPQDKERLFQRFSQASPSISRKFGGSGLGLMICKHITKAMGGNIRLVDSQEGQGSTFEFTVQCKRSQTKEEEREDTISLSTDTTIHTSKLSILLVEDNESIGKTIVLQLKRLGYDCIKAINGEEAINLYKTHTFDVILMDINMPEMSGLEATQKIRNQEKILNSSPAHILGLSANTFDDELKRKIKESGMNGYLAKPFTKDALKKAIEPIDDQPRLARTWPKSKPSIHLLGKSVPFLSSPNPPPSQIKDEEELEISTKISTSVKHMRSQSWSH